MHGTNSFPQVPSNMLITRVKPGIYMSGWMIVWAAVSGEHPRMSDLALLYPRMLIAD